MIAKDTEIEVIVRTGDLECRFFSINNDNTEATVRCSYINNATLSLSMDVDQMRSTTTLLTPQPGDLWHHVKTGHIVTILHRARSQHADPQHDMKDVVVYRHDGNTWTRSLAEFMDGRFTWVCSK